MKKIIITGTVGAQPVLRNSQYGEFVSFNVGVRSGTKENPKTDWIDCTAKDKIAEIVKSYLQKGTKVLIEGIPSARAYLNKDNQPVGVLSINVTNLEMLSKNEEPQTQPSFKNNDLESDIPF